MWDGWWWEDDGLCEGGWKDDGRAAVVLCGSDAETGTGTGVGTASFLRARETIASKAATWWCRQKEEGKKKREG